MGDFWPLTWDHTGEYALLVAVLLAVCHLAGPWIRNSFHKHSARVISFGGGLAVAYVFLQLVPEIEHAHEVVGDRIHILILVSFLLFYAVELRFLRSHELSAASDDTVRDERIFWLHVALSALYTWMIVFALPSELTGELTFAVLGSLAIGLHIIYKGYVLHTQHREAYERKGRYVLAMAPILGWFTHIVVQPSEFLFDVFIAVLAGFLMQSVFREELPSYDQTRLRWMSLGVVVFFGLVVVTP